MYITNGKSCCICRSTLRDQQQSSLRATGGSEPTLVSFLLSPIPSETTKKKSTIWASDTIENGRGAVRAIVMAIYKYKIILEASPPVPLAQIPQLFLHFNPLHIFLWRRNPRITGTRRTLHGRTDCRWSNSTIWRCSDFVCLVENQATT